LPRRDGLLNDTYSKGRTYLKLYRLPERLSLFAWPCFSGQDGSTLLRTAVRRIPLMTTKAALKWNSNLTRKQLMQLELFIASIVPTAAILVVGVAGTAVNFNFIFFTLNVLACALAVFFGERSIILKLQDTMDEQLTDLITTCREFIQGNNDLRVSMPG